jgi:hypothetical protein
MPGGAWEDEHGKRTITRDKIILTPTPGGQTAAAYWAGQPAPYLLSWLDKDGTPHMLNRGRPSCSTGRPNGRQCGKDGVRG